jgi:hypothetical protein
LTRQYPKNTQTVRFAVPGAHGAKTVISRQAARVLVGAGLAVSIKGVLYPSRRSSPGKILDAIADIDPIAHAKIFLWQGTET